MSTGAEEMEIAGEGRAKSSQGIIRGTVRKVR